jgi:hypothetical protein
MGEGENQQFDEMQNSIQSQSNNQNSIEFARYLREVEKFPFEMEALQTSIESNKSTVKLAEESISHFKDSRIDNKKTLLATLGISILTLIILIVQTCSTNKTEIVGQIELKPEQVEYIIKSQQKNSFILNTRVDSLESEIGNLNNKLIQLKYKK